LQPDVQGPTTCDAAVSIRSLIPAGCPSLALACGGLLQRLPLVSEPRGTLVFAEVAQHLPFVPKRFFAVFDAPEHEMRGLHAHLVGHEFLISLQGTWIVTLDDTRTRQTLALDTPDVGLHIPPRVWRSFFRQGGVAVLASLSSETYDPSDYVRDYSDFACMMRA